MIQKNKTQNRLLSLLLALTLVFGMIPMSSMTAYAAADAGAYAPTRKENYRTAGNCIFANGTAITIEAAPNGTRVWYMDGSTKRYVTYNGENGEDLSEWKIFVGSNNDDGMRGVNGSVTMTGGTVWSINAGQYYGYFRGTSNITITGGTVTNGIYCNAAVATSNNDYISTVTIFDAVGTTIDARYGGKADNVVQKKDGVWSVSGNGVIPSGVTLTVGAGEALTVPKDATLTNNGSLVNNGTMELYGPVHGNAFTGSGTVNCYAAYIEGVGSVGSISAKMDGNTYSLQSGDYYLQSDRLYIWLPSGNAKVTLNGTDYYGVTEAGKRTELTSSYMGVGSVTISGMPTEIGANANVTLAAKLTEETTLTPAIGYEIVSSTAQGTTLTGSTLYAAGAGKVTVKVTVSDGYTAKSENFEINVKHTPVTGLSADVPASIIVNAKINLPKVLPSDASYQTITWSIISGQSDTGATINNGVLTATKKGTFKIRATVENGTAYGTNYTKDFIVKAVALDKESSLDISVGSITISQNTDGTLKVEYSGYDGDGYRNFAASDLIVITGETSTNRVIVKSGSPNVVLSDCKIYSSGRNGPFEIQSGASVKLILNGTNNLENSFGGVVTGSTSAGLYVPQGASVIIEGEGSLNAYSKMYAGIGAADASNPGSITINGGTVNATGRTGIGGTYKSSTGDITINGGTVNANGGSSGAGIGGGSEGSVANITINGGVVTASCDGSWTAAAIGGGLMGSGGNIKITGGTVTALNNATSFSGAAIGGGCRASGGTIVITGGNVNAYAKAANAIGAGADSSGGTLTDGNGNSVSKVTFTLDGVTETTVVTAIETEGCTYGVEDVSTLDTNKLYFYLPSGANVTSVTTENGKYICNGNNTFYKEHEFDDNGICRKSTDEPHYKAAEYDEENNVYKIANLGNLLWFRKRVNGGDTKINAILTADINGKDDVAKTIGIGTNDHPYEGVFDGNGKTLDIRIDSTEQYAAPFGYVNGATIKNLTVTGSITSSQKFAASFIGATTGGTVTLEKCISEVTITSTVSGDGTNGGLIAVVRNGETKINNCAFVGAYVTSTTTHNGGFVSWANNNTKTYITNSFLAADFSNVKTDGCNTFSRNPNYVTVEKCYYLTALGDVPSGATQKNDKQFASGEVAWLLNGSVDNGTWKQTFYTDKIPNFSGGAVYKTTGNCDSYTNNAAEKNRNHVADESGFCEYCGKIMNFMPAVWNESKQVYEISNAKQLVWFAELVNGTLEGTKQNQSANAVLMNDIDMSEITDYVPIGGTTGLYYSADGDDKGYQGTFDGNGHVIKNLSVNGSDTKELTYGVFGTLSGTVKHLGVESFTFILGSQDCRAGGITGQMLTAGLIEDCYVANSAINATGKVAGGIAGCNYAGKITNCHTYKVTVTATRAGGIVGDNRGDGGTDDRKGSIINCYTDASSLENSARAGTMTNSTANVSSADFASGRIGFLLGGSREIWKQTIGSQDYPTFSGNVINIDGYNVTETLISAKITWTAIEFTYTAGDWDSSTHSYGAGKWTMADGSGKVTVENTGNRKLYTKFTYTSNIVGVTGKFDIGHTVVESKQSVTSKLTLEGKPDSWNSMLGMIEVKISRNPIDNTWNVGDEVKWIGTDGNEYTCTVVSKSNSGYVLITSNCVKQTKGRTFENIAQDAQNVDGRLPNTQVSAEKNYIKKKIGTSSVRIPVYRSEGTYAVFRYDGKGYLWSKYSSSKQYDVYYAFDVPIS